MVGRVESRVGGESFKIRWYKRKSPKSKQFIKTDMDLEEVEDASVILWGFSSARTENSFKIERVYQLKLEKIYQEHDTFMRE